MLNILILEDNEKERHYCIHLIRDILRDCNILEGKDAEEALVLSKQEEVDLFFLDVELPGMSGFQFAEQIRQNEEYILTPIVFITGVHTNQLSIHKKYHHYEYMEKPLLKESFMMTMEPILKNMDVRKGQKRNRTKEQRLLLLETADLEQIVHVSHILFAEANQRVLRVALRQTTNGCQVLDGVTMALKNFVDEVDEPFFIQCHKSFAVNVKEIKQLEKVSRRLWLASFGEEIGERAQISEKFINQVKNEMVTTEE